MAKRDIFKEAEFFQKLKANEISTPNEFTIQMGLLIKKAREEKGWSQEQLANEISRRRATISNIENGKSEIGVLTLVLLAAVLKRPITYFLPENILKDMVSEVNNPLEREMLMKFREIEYEGNPVLALKMIELLIDYFTKEPEEFEGEPTEEDI